MIESRGIRIALRVASALVLAFLYLPLVILTIYAFNPSRIMAWPPTGFTLQWFAEAAANPSVGQAIVNSLVVATIATALALVLGTLASLAVQRY
jgi:putative spermidine/putrescine transport system permease protein